MDCTSEQLDAHFTMHMKVPITDTTPAELHHIRGAHQHPQKESGFPPIADILDSICIRSCYLACQSTTADADIT